MVHENDDSTEGVGDDVARVHITGVALADQLASVEDNIENLVPDQEGGNGDMHPWE